MFHIFISCGISTGAINDQNIEIGVRKNGSVVVSSIMGGGAAGASAVVRNNSLNSMITLEKGDIIDVAVRILADTDDLTFKNLYICVEGNSFHNSLDGIP